MTAAELTLIDDQVLVACTVDEAMQLLDGPDPIAAWFRATRNETTTTITSAEGDCVLERTSERWHPTDQALTIDGRIGDIHVHAHLTLMAVVHSISDGHVNHGTEIWVHAELGQRQPSPSCREDHHRGDRTWARAPSTGTRSVSERGVSEPSPDG